MTNKPNQGFSLIETMLWEDGGYFLLDLHMDRLAKSAGYFSFPCDSGGAVRSLEELAFSFDPTKKYRVRLLLDGAGRFSLASAVLDAMDTLPVKVALSEQRTDAQDTFLYHKTTNRKLYDSELARYRAESFFDVIFMNREGEVTEGAVTNIIIRKGNDHFTPPLPSGLLDGTYRKHLLKSQEIPLKEKVLRLEDLSGCDDLFLINSVRKTVPAVLDR